MIQFQFVQQGVCEPRSLAAIVLLPTIAFRLGVRLLVSLSLAACAQFAVAPSRQLVCCFQWVVALGAYGSVQIRHRQNVAKELRGFRVLPLIWRVAILAAPVLSASALAY